MTLHIFMIYLNLWFVPTPIYAHLKELKNNIDYIYYHNNDNSKLLLTIDVERRQGTKQAWKTNGTEERPLHLAASAPRGGGSFP